MSPFLAALLAMVGPILSELLKKWFDKLAKKTEAALAASGTLVGLSDGAKTSLVLGNMLDATPRRQKRKRAFLRAAMADLPHLVEAGVKKIPAAAKAELAGLAADAEGE